jgi:hypothetical protein
VESHSGRKPLRPERYYKLIGRYGEEKRFKRVAQLHIGDIWASHLAWSDWTDLDENTCENPPIRESTS